MNKCINYIGCLYQSNLNKMVRVTKSFVKDDRVYIGIIFDTEYSGFTPICDQILLEDVFLKTYKPIVT